jgi:antagonist of KipI
LGGAEFGEMPRWQPVRVSAGERLTLGAARTGCRGYLAIAGGLEVPPVLGGRGTYLRAALGGHEGRALRDGDCLRAAEVARQVVGRWRIDEQILPSYSSAPVVRVVAGAQANQFDAAGLEADFRVSPKSDRMGVRFTGPAIVRHTADELVSEPAVQGTVQVPPDGQPIALMADAQTLGGYPQIAHAITVDLPLLAQARPGNTVRFRRVTLETAHRLLNAREHALALLREGLLGKLR